MVLESAAASTVALDTDWRPIRDGVAIAIMAEPTARAVRPADVAVVPVQPPPQYVLALAARRCEQAVAVHRFLSYLRSHREQHAWVANPEFAPPTRIAARALSSAVMAQVDSDLRQA
jgi:hypothetical protein